MSPRVSRFLFAVAGVGFATVTSVGAAGLVSPSSNPNLFVPQPGIIGRHHPITPSVFEARSSIQGTNFQALLEALQKTSGAWDPKSKTWNAAPIAGQWNAIPSTGQMFPATPSWVFASSKYMGLPSEDMMRVARSLSPAPFDPHPGFAGAPDLAALFRLNGDPGLLRLQQSHPVEQSLSYSYGESGPKKLGRGLKKRESTVAASPEAQAPMAIQPEASVDADEEANVREAESLIREYESLKRKGGGGMKKAIPVLGPNSV